jgi:hypothetical protein
MYHYQRYNSDSSNSDHGGYDYDTYGDDGGDYDDVFDDFYPKQSNLNHPHFSSNRHTVYDSYGVAYYHTNVFYHGDSIGDSRVRGYLKFDEFGNVIPDCIIQSGVDDEDIEDVIVLDIFNGDFENVPRQIAQKDAISLAFYAFLCNNNVPNAWYLFKCKWFTQSFALGCLLSSVVKAGHAHRINVYADDFQQHLEELML